MKTLLQKIRHPMLVAGLLILAIKTLFWICDPWPMVFMGDSGTYIHTAYTGAVPGARSFVYGFLVWLFAVVPHSFYCLVVVQVAASALSVILLCYSLKKYFSARNSVALLMGLLFALDPMQLMYERFVMTETFSLLVFVLYCVQVFAYLKRPAAFRLILIQATSVLLIALRLSFLIPVLINVLLVPLLGARVIAKQIVVAPRRPFLPRFLVQRPAWWRVPTHLAVSLLAAFLFHQGYQRLNGFLSNKPPAYQYNDGFWLVSVWAPVINPEDSPNPQISDLIARGDEYGFHDIYVRNGQRFSSKGFVARLRSIEPDEQRANKYCKRIALNALKRNPIGIARLAAKTYSHWGRQDMIAVMLRDDEGLDPNTNPQYLDRVAQRMYLPASLFKKITPTKKYYASSAFWYYCLLHAPLVSLLAMVLRRDASWFPNLFLFVTSVSIFVTICVLSTQAVYRYAHPFSFIFLISAGVVLDRLVCMWESLKASATMSRPKTSTESVS